MRIRLKPGVWYNATTAVLGGGGTVMGATASGMIAAIGWAGVALGVGLFVWGFEINERPWWYWRRKKPMRINPEAVENAKPKMIPPADAALKIWARHLHKHDD